MGFRIRTTGEYFPTEFALRDYFGGTVKVRSPVTSEWMEDHGIDPVFEGPQAQPTRYQIAFSDGLTQDDQGRWFSKYSVSDMDDEAKAALDAQQANSVRTSRNDMLKDCDWTQITDSTADKAVWATYRQALRDVTAQAGFPWNVDWPTQPE